MQYSEKLAPVPRRAVVSLCHMGHADVWKLTSNLLPEFLDANDYYVYVPEDEINEFKKITNSKINIVPETVLGKEYYGLLRDRVEFSNNSKRFTWYLQQFYKIEALVKAEANQLVIWDSDCVPLKRIHTFNDEQVPIYLEASKEHHATYFESISKLLHLEKYVTFSFITPAFPIPKIWVSQFIKELEEIHSRPWHEAIIENSDFSVQSGFSEFETLGTWCSNRYPNSWVSYPASWERYGQSRFGYAKDFNLDSVLDLGAQFDLDVISFENWDISAIS
jgi:Family of unknown function (DUF6492)